MYKKRKNYKSLFNKIKKKGNWHFDPSKKSKDAKYLGRIKLSNDIVSGAIKSVEKSPLIPAVQLYKKDLINKAYEKTPVAWGKVDNIQAGYNASNTLFNTESQNETLSSGKNMFIVDIERLGLLPDEIYVLRLNNLKRVLYLKFKYEEN